MSTLALDDTTAGETAHDSLADNQVDVKLDELIVGRNLTHPIYDADGLLLLAEGSRITSEFRRILKQRGMVTVKMHAEDADRVRLCLDQNDGDADSDACLFDSALTSQLDRVIESGLLQLKNTGPALRESVVKHGAKGYDAKQSAEMRRQHDESAASLDHMMKDAVRGKSACSGAVTSLATKQLFNLVDDTDCVIATAVEASLDNNLANHSLKMSTLGMAIGVEMGLDEDNCKRICVAGLVHDWGMGKVPEWIRSYPERMSEDLFFQIKKHPIYTAEMLERMPGLPSMVPVIAYQVHERPNGMGYPRGRSGDRIHLLARILNVADTYAALTTTRPYRGRLTPYAAMECLVKLAKTRDVDPEVVRAFLKVMNLFPIGSYVALCDGSVAQVIRRNGDHYTKPILRVVQDEHGQPRPHNDAAIIDLTQTELQIIQALPTPGQDEQLLTEDILYPTRSRT